jgi:hypothetical protein
MPAHSSVVVLVISLIMFASVLPAVADEVPITGSVQAVDPVQRTLTVHSAAKGKVRVVVIEVRAGSKIVRFARGPDGKGGFTEQAASLEDIKPGWMVSVKTHHDGDREVADVIRVVHEK